MNKLNKNQWIAVVSSLALLAYLLYGGSIMEIFNQSNNSNPEVNANTVQSSGVDVQELAAGQGVEVMPGDIVTVHYVGTLTDGRVFDSSRDRNIPFSFTLGAGEVIRGWDEGLVGMRIGGKRMLTIKPEYGYGAQAVGPIPANSTLIFEVELLDARKPN